MKSRERCLNCNQTMLPTYKGNGKKFCNRSCNTLYRQKSGYWKIWYQNKESTKIRNQRKCVVCERNIKDVGQKKNISKYCSDRCMIIAQGIRENGQRYVEVKMTIPQYRIYTRRNRNEM